MYIILYYISNFIYYMGYSILYIIHYYHYYYYCCYYYYCHGYNFFLSGVLSILSWLSLSDLILYVYI